MKRFVLAIGMLAFLVPLTGCGGGPPGTTAAGVPSEVEAYEKRRAEERAKGIIVPKATAPTAPTAPGGGFNPR